jgi:RNA polymerase sigma-70 factor (ECF subfamily)
VDDRELLARLRRGNEQAFDALFRQYYGMLVGLAESFLRRRAIAEEVAQEVMLEVWRRRETITIEETWRAYLFRAVRNRSLNELRREQVEDRAEPHIRPDGPSSASALTGLVEQELDSAIVRAIDDLPAPMREVFQMSRTGGLKYAEIAETLGVSVKTVEARMGRALKELRERLAQWLPESNSL